MHPEIRVIFVLYLEQVLHEIATHVNTTYNSSSRMKCVLLQTFVILLESADRYSVLVSVTPLLHSASLNRAVLHTT